jgi:hypothetical protein
MLFESAHPPGKPDLAPHRESLDLLDLAPERPHLHQRDDGEDDRAEEEHRENAQDND